MHYLNTALLINLLGFAVGIALYILLMAMVLRHKKKGERVDFLLLLTAAMGIVWNTEELFSFVWQDFVKNPLSPMFTAISYSALGFLPSVVVHSAENENKDSRILTITSYILSTFAAILHFQNVITNGIPPSNLALQILTFGSVALAVGLLFFNYKQKLENKTVWVAALLVFAVSTLHLSSNSEGSNWLIELTAHQSSLPLVLAILVQDYRFAFADLFLKRALSLLLLTLMVFLVYAFIAQPLSLSQLSYQEDDFLSDGFILFLWITTALIYPFLHKFSMWLVDKILLKRIGYDKLKRRISSAVERYESIDLVLDLVSEKLGNALTSEKTFWDEISGFEGKTELPSVEITAEHTRVFVPTNEPPFYVIYLRNFAGGRKLLSEEVKMLEAVSLLTARRIDVLRIVHERYKQKLREQEYTKLTTEAQLTALRSQVHPHFLFNALTTIGYLIQTAPDKALQTLMRLTQLLRSFLKTGGKFCTLEEELKLIENYLDIEKARFENRLGVEIDVPKNLGKIDVPSLILQPLVENAVKHGVSENKDGGTVKISACLKETEKAEFLKLRVFDTGAGKRTNDSASSTGIGLENVKGRLKNYYGNEAYLRFGLDPVKGTTAEISFPIKTQSIL